MTSALKQLVFAALLIGTVGAVVLGDKSNSKCEENEIWSECPSCERTCEKPIDDCKTACPQPKCVCVEDFARNVFFVRNDDGKCVSRDSCPTTKRRNRIRTTTPRPWRTVERPQPSTTSRSPVDGGMIDSNANSPAAKPKIGGLRAWFSSLFSSKRPNDESTPSSPSGTAAAPKSSGSPIASSSEPNTSKPSGAMFGWIKALFSSVSKRKENSDDSESKSWSVKSSLDSKPSLSQTRSSDSTRDRLKSSKSRGSSSSRSRNGRK